MSVDLRGLAVQTILLDIEGTTTPMAFVHEVLFPFARRRLPEYLRADRDEVRTAIAALQSDSGSPAMDRAQLSTHVESLMDRDVKSPGLKLLQGLIWQAGYASGELRGQVYSDVPPAFERFKRAGVRIAIYSSGSVLAQKLLFSTVPQQNLVDLIDAFFDTSVGPKSARDSYRHIAGAMQTAPPHLLFVSDVPVELDAARDVGCQVALCVRPGNPVQQLAGNWPTIHTFDDLST